VFKLFISIVFSYIQVSPVGEFRLGTDILDEHKSPIAKFVQLCELYIVGFAGHLRMYFYSIRNMLLYTVCNSSTCYCAKMI
jgi:hypothetical protein